MNQNTWSLVDHYFSEMLIEKEDCMEQALKASEVAKLPPHNVAPNQGKLLYLIARIQKAQKILEIGTLGGYSTIWLARALPNGGRLVTLEADPRNAAVAAANLNRAGLSTSVTIRIGLAIETLDAMISQDEGPFDLIFIDADKPNNPAYLEKSIELSCPGTVIIADNVVRKGEVANPLSENPKVQGVRDFFELMSGHPKLSATAIQTVGSKGYDGFSIAVVND